MNPWSRLQWVNKKLKSIEIQKARMRLETDKLYKERARLREIMAAELRGWPNYHVTRRESEVLTLLATNPLLTNKEIANSLFITERTAKFHLSSLLKKFDATNRGELAIISEKTTKEAVQ